MTAKPTLVVAPSWIGDTLIAQPLLTRLAERGAQIHVLAPAANRPLLERMSEVAQVLTNPFGHGDFAFGARKALGQQLRAADYQAAYVLPNSWKSALVPFFARIPRRVGYTGEARYGLLNCRHQLDKAGRPWLVDRYLQLAEAPGAPLPENRPRPHLNSTPAQQSAARAALGLDERPALVFCPGAEYGAAKRWPAHHFAALARQLPADWQIWILGAPKDGPVGDAIAQASHGRARNLCGRTRLDQAIDLIASAAAVVSNDSGLMHVGAALDRPLVAVYGSSSPRYTPPLSPAAHILSLGLPCSPCFKRECPLGHLDCLEKLTPEQVGSVLAPLLKPTH